MPKTSAPQEKTMMDFDYDEWSRLTEDQKYHRLLERISG
jgi:hypothetical protein